MCRVTMQQGASPDQTVTFSIADTLDLRIAISRIAKLPGMAEASDLDRSLVATMISELGTNIIKYAGRGQISARMITLAEGRAIEVTARDMGPGIADISLALQDHYSTGNSLGLGLPAVQRMSDAFSISSQPGQGTLVVARKLIGAGAGRVFVAARPQVRAASKGPARQEPSGIKTWEAGACVRPMPGTIRGGDAALILETPTRLLLAIVDVTGHGETAGRLRSRIEAQLQAQPGKEITALMRDLHELMIGTIGAAVGLMSIDLTTARFAYIGVGNTGASRVAGERWRGLSKDGLLGARFPTPLPQEGQLMPEDTLLFWTDGISEKLCSKYVIENRSVPAETLARRAVRTFGKLHDDAGCLIFRWLA